MHPDSTDGSIGFYALNFRSKALFFRARPTKLAFILSVVEEQVQRKLEEQGQATCL